MKNMMQALIGMDYERGLLMLKDYLETGTVACQLSIQGKPNSPAQLISGLNARVFVLRWLRRCWKILQA